MRTGRLKNYWVMSGTSRILADYLRKSDFSLDDLTTQWVSEDTLCSVYSKENPLSLSFQTGYLTIGEYCNNDTYRLRVPNQEVQSALVDLLIPEFVEEKHKRGISSLTLDLSYAIEQGDVEPLMLGLLSNQDAVLNK